MTKYYIYGLHLDGDEEIRYVGSTKRKLQERLWGHLNECKKRGGPKNEWVKSHSGSVRITVLATVNNDPKLTERQMILKLYKEGHKLLNRRQPRRLNKEERKRYTKSWLKRINP